MRSYMLRMNKAFLTVTQIGRTGWHLRNCENTEKITDSQGTAVEDNWRINLNEKLICYQIENIYDETNENTVYSFYV